MSDEANTPKKDPPDLKGKIPRNITLSPMEIEALRKQGLWDDTNDAPSEEALQPKKPKDLADDIPSHLPKPQPLTLMDPQKSQEIDKAAEAIKSASDEELNDMQIDTPLPPPTGAATDPEDEVAEVGPPPEFTGLTDIDAASAISKSKTPVGCPRCGWDHREKFAEPKVTEDDKIQFLRHLLSKGRFYKTYTIMGGKIKVTFRSRTDGENLAIWEQGKHDLRSKEAGGADRLSNEVELQAQLIKYQLTASVSSVDSNDGPERFHELLSIKDDEEVSEEDVVFHKMMERFGGDTPPAWYNILYAQFMEFERLYQWLTARAHDPDFWSTAAGDL
jgi:hypothetical protein